LFMDQRKAKKSLGQYFTRCQWVISTLVKSAGVGPEDFVLEIGPGTGILTRALAAQANRVLAVEKDERLADELKKSLKKERCSNVEVVMADILRFTPIFSRYKIVANIPYYLTSRLLRLIFEEWSQPEVLVLTVQKEVAQRIVARPPKMNLLAFAVQFFGRPEIVKIVPPACFSPRPKVASAIIKIVPREKIPVVRQEEVFRVARAVFSNRRKTVLNNLSGLMGKECAKAILDKTGIEQRRRGGELAINDIVSICETMSL